MIEFADQAIGQNKFPVGLVDQASIEQAKAIRARRDARYGNIYRELSTDERWVGDLGEIVLDRWLSAKGAPHQWLSEDDAAGKHDFELAGIRVGAKTVKRKVPMLPHYTAQVTARHVYEPVHQFFFMCYEFPRNAMWLLGGIAKEDFLRDAVHYGAGEKVHSNYVIRPGHEIFNIEIRHLQPPAAWLGSMVQQSERTNL